MPDWFRKVSWTGEDQADFRRRLARASPGNRPQYLYLQGYTLMQEGAAWRSAAMTLFDEYIDSYPSDIRLASALTHKAECFALMGDHEAALTWYGRAVDQMRAGRNIQTWAWLEFVWLVATLARADRYDEALALLAEFEARQSLAFPVVTFKREGSRAFILAARGAHDEAAAAARRALAAADTATSGLRYHPSIGLVGAAYGELRKRLRKVADAPAC